MRLYHLDRHREIHIREKRFVCIKCGFNAHLSSVAFVYNCSLSLFSWAFPEVNKVITKTNRDLYVCMVFDRWIC